MTCKNCGKILADVSTNCPNCGNYMKTLNFHNNKLGENGKMAEYVTEKYNMKKGIYEVKNKDTNINYKGLLIILIVIFIIILMAIANYFL